MQDDRETSAYQNITVTRLAPSVGAEVSGVDLSKPIGDAQFQETRNALGTFGVIFLRDQDISPADQLRFAKSFGDININRFFHPVDGFPEIANVQRQPDERGATGWYWHTDHSYDQAPAMCSILHCIETPETGGDTMYASMYSAFDALSDGMKDTLRGLQAWHSSRHVFGAARAKRRLDSARARIQV